MSKTIDELAREHNAARKAVTDWMDAEGREGRLRHNDQAPGWPEYERARKALDAAISSVGTKP